MTNTTILWKLFSFIEQKWSNLRKRLTFWAQCLECLCKQRTEKMETCYQIYRPQLRVVSGTKYLEMPEAFSPMTCSLVMEKGRMSTVFLSVRYKKPYQLTRHLHQVVSSKSCMTANHRVTSLLKTATKFYKTHNKMLPCFEYFETSICFIFIILWQS